MGNRILARVVANRLGVRAEKIWILDENQAGFRNGRSTADLVQVMVRMQEGEWRSKKEREERVLEEGEWPETRLLDLKKLLADTTIMVTTPPL